MIIDLPLKGGVILIVSEKEMCRMIIGSKSILLLEPKYFRRHYLPFGLAKISTYAKKHKNKITFKQSYDKRKYDLICISVVFTYHVKYLNQLIRAIRFVDKNVKILCGGVAVTLVSDEIKQDENVFLFKGISKILDKYLIDYSIDWKLDHKDFSDYSFVTTSRGCPNKCAYCAVWRLEKERYVVDNWKEQIQMDKGTVVISDNNLAYFGEDHFLEVLDYLNKHDKKVLLEGGIDCKHFTPTMAKAVASTKFFGRGIRIAFDRIEEDGIFQDAVKLLLAEGISGHMITAFCLYNFKDTPREADYRCNECYKLGIRPYPQPYKPLNLKSFGKQKTYISPNWTQSLQTAFRTFWMPKGEGFTKLANVTFEEYLKSAKIRKSINMKINITRDDIRAWHNREGGF